MRKDNTIGVFLILAGIVWIINITGIVSINWYESLKIFWPVILVAIGINLMVKNHKVIKTLVWVMAFIIFVGFGVYQVNGFGRFHFDSSRLNTKIKYNEVKKEPAENEVLLPAEAEKGKVVLSLGAVKLNLSEGSRELFVKVDSDIPNLTQYLSEGKQTIIEYGHEKYNAANSVRNFNLRMNPGIPWEIEANIGAADGKLDLSSIQAEHIDLSIGAGDLELIIGEQKESTTINLRAGAAEMVLYIPEGAGLKVENSKFLSDISFNNISMKSKNGEYISENYENADQIIDLNILTAISAIQIYAK